MKSRFLLFKGCLIPTRLPFLEKSSKIVLDSLEIDYDPMSDATCCVEPIGLRSLAADTWLASAARLLSIAESEGKYILTLCNGCYMSLQEANHLLQSPEIRSRANETLRSVGREYQGRASVKHLISVIRD